VPVARLAAAHAALSVKVGDWPGTRRCGFGLRSSGRAARPPWRYSRGAGRHARPCLAAVGGKL